MLSILVLSISLTAVAGQINEIEICTTLPTPTGTSRPEPCVFPFSFDNVTFFEVNVKLQGLAKIDFLGCVINRPSRL